MQDTSIFVEKIDGTKRQIDWTELNQLKKDILWIFDENGGDLINAFVPDYSFTLPYWEFVTINGDKFSFEKQKKFYREGTLIIILCMTIEYIDIQGGNQLFFSNHKIEDVFTYIRQFQPANESQNSLKEFLILGLSIAASITKEDIARNEDFEHPDLHHFLTTLYWVDKTFIHSYYKSKQT